MREGQGGGKGVWGREEEIFNNSRLPNAPRAAECSVPRAQSPVPSAQCPVPSAHCSLLTTQCSVLRANCSVLSAQCSVLSAHCSVLTALCSVLRAQCSVLSAQCSLLSAHCSVLSAQCSVLVCAEMACQDDCQGSRSQSWDAWLSLLCGQGTTNGASWCMRWMEGTAVKGIDRQQADSRHTRIGCSAGRQQFGGRLVLVLRHTFMCVFLSQSVESTE